MLFNKLNFVKFILLLLSIFNACETIKGAKILALFPFPGPSQYILVQPYLKALAAKGHQVTVINAFPQKQKIENFRDIPVMEVHENYDDVIGGVQEERNLWQELTFINDFFVDITEKVLKNPSVQQLLKTESFDLIIMEVIHTDAWYSLGRHFNAPMIGLSSFGNDPVIDELMGNISPFSYVPLVTSGLTENMNFVERLRNTMLSLLDLIHVRLVNIPRQRQLMKLYMPHIKEDISELRKNFSLMLLNQHFSLSFPRPYVPSMIEVGGFQIHYKAKPLPVEMQKFINESQQDIIYFSMGSNIKSKDLGPKRLQVIIDVFKQLPYRIMWKFENTELPGKPSNVFISSWFPQPDILAHPKVKLFISHGGLLSTIESIYHAKPILGIPVFYDQNMNVNRAKQGGFALSVDFTSFEKESFKNNILEIMNNPKYAEKSQQISKRYHDQPVAPLDLAIYWTEYILRHEGAAHLQAPAQHMCFVKRHSIDTLGVLLGAAVLIVIAFAWLALGIFKLIFNKKAKKQKLN